MVHLNVLMELPYSQGLSQLMYVSPFTLRHRKFKLEHYSLLLMYEGFLCDCSYAANLLNLLAVSSSDYIVSFLWYAAVSSAYKIIIGPTTHEAVSSGIKVLYI